MKQQLTKLIETLKYKKYMDYNVTVKNDINNLITTSTQDIEMNKIDVFIKSNDIEQSKKFIEQINSDDNDKWTKFSILYQKIHGNRTLTQILLIKMMGWTDYHFMNFYDIGNTILSEIGESNMDTIIIDILTNDKIKMSLEALRKDDVKLIKMYDMYDNKKEFGRLLKNLLLVQLNNFVIKMKPYCWGMCWGKFIDKIIEVSNDKINKI
jgi:hypothetical protein